MRGDFPRTEELIQKNPLFSPRAIIGDPEHDFHGMTYPVQDPATGEVVAEVSDCDEKRADRALSVARDAFRHWRRSLPQERARCLRRWGDLILAHREQLAELLTIEAGKPLKESLAEVSYGASFVEWFAEEARRSYGELIPTFAHGRRLLTTREPVGPVLAITPWNFPLAMVTRKCAPALAAGCSVILKPAEATPLTAIALGRLALEAGFPEGALSVFTCSRDQVDRVSQFLLRAPALRKLTFTGSTAVGKHLMASAAETVKRVSLELGGNAPLIVFDDADLERALDGIMASKFRNSGQTCICPNRIYVHEKIFDAVEAGLSARIAALKVGHGLTPGVDIGPLINEAAAARVEEVVQRATQQGQLLSRGFFADTGEHWEELVETGAEEVKVVQGGERLLKHGPNFYAPTLLSPVSDANPIGHDELFGPVAVLIPFRDECAVLRAANNTRAGLAAYLFTGSQRRAWQFSEGLEYGMVAINDGSLSTAIAPFGGVKESGIGREGARQGLDEFLEVKYLMFGDLGALIGD